MSAHRFPPSVERAYPVVDGRIVTRSLESHVVDHCNLTCAECCSLSPHLPRWSIRPEDLARDLALARGVLAPRVFKLVGGEPLLHPDIVELALVARRSGIAERISITTNGLLLGRAPDALFDAIDALTISLYPAPALGERAIAEIEERAARFDVALNWKRQDAFVHMTRDARATDEAEVASVFHDCWLRERCHMIRAGRFYACTRPPHLQAFLASDFTEDGLALGDNDDGLRDRLLAYLLREEPLAACAWCFGGSARMSPHRLLDRTELVRARRA